MQNTNHGTRTSRRWMCWSAALFAGLLIAGEARGISTDLANVVAGNNQFAFDLYHTLSSGGGDGNLFFSPMSVSTALGMTYGGARGQTAREMADVFHFDLPQDGLHAAYQEYLTDLASPERQGYELSIANRIWGQDGFPFHQSYLDLTREQYGAELGVVDFVNDTENSRQTINRWVEDQTQNRIRDLLPEGVVTPDTRLVLTNAVYFLADWRLPFNPAYTADGAFQASPTEQIDVEMMNLDGHFRYAELPQGQMLEMPYQGEDVSMVLMLPSEVDGGLDALDDWLTAETFDEAIQMLESQYVGVSMPRFKIESEVPLSDVLQQMGMSTAFSDFADFSGIAEVGLKISDVVHKAFLRVNEEGSEAAAATGVVAVPTSFTPPPDTKFEADHPFLLALRDNRTESLLFMGRVTRPEYNEDEDSRASPPLAGDFNDDGIIDQADLDLVLLNWGKDGSQYVTGWIRDLPDRVVDQDDLDATLLNWGASVAVTPAAGIPEPSTGLLALIGLLATARWYRKRR